MSTHRPEHPEDNLMDRFDRARLRRFRSRDALTAVAIAAVVLMLCAGASIRKAGHEMSPGLGRDAVLAVGDPAGWLADRLPFQRPDGRALAQRRSVRPRWVHGYPGRAFGRWDPAGDRRRI
jgi:hypothetical protein